MNETDFVSDILFGNKEKISDALKSYVANEMQPLLALVMATEAQLKLETLTNLLVAKGVITQKEIDAAKAAADVYSTFVPIYSLNNKYEINRAGVVRNVATKLVLKTKANGKCVSIQLNAHKYISRAIADLLWETHGKIIKRRFRPCPCSAESKSGKRFFDNLTQCAHFLAPKVFYAVGTVKDYLCRRDPFIGEWKITYLMSAPPSPRLEVHGLNREARCMKKLDEELGL